MQLAVHAWKSYVSAIVQVDGGWLWFPPSRNIKTFKTNKQDHVNQNELDVSFLEHMFYYVSKLIEQTHAAKSDVTPLLHLDDLIHLSDRRTATDRPWQCLFPRDPVVPNLRFWHLHVSVSNTSPEVRYDWIAGD